MCYTNHALDQFLEGITRFCEGNKLIRIGGKSQSQALQEFNLSNIKTKMRNNRQVPTYVHNGRLECMSTIKECQNEISSLEQQVKDLGKRIVGSQLRDVIMS